MTDKVLRDPPPTRVDEVRIVGFGTLAWVVAFLGLLVFRDRLADAGRLWWLGTCAAGAGLGAIGLVVVRRRARRGRDAAHMVTAGYGEADPGR